MDISDTQCQGFVGLKAKDFEALIDSFQIVEHTRDGSGHCVISILFLGDRMGIN